MISLKSLLIVTSITLASTAVLAQPLNVGGKYIDKVDYKTITVAPSPSKQLAYDVAFAKLNSLEDSSTEALNKYLGVINFDVLPNQTHLKEGGYVTVKERMSNGGQIEYVGTINVKVHYVERSSEH